MTAQPHSAVILSEENFSALVLRNKRPSLVDFWAEWCGLCQVMNPVLPEIASDFAGRLMVGKVNVDEHSDLAARYQVQSIPTRIVFRDGQEIERIVGAVRKHVLSGRLTALLKASR